MEENDAKEKNGALLNSSFPRWNCDSNKNTRLPHIGYMEFFAVPNFVAPTTKFGTLV
jgi:hypothetical protein